MAGEQKPPGKNTGGHGNRHTEDRAPGDSRGDRAGGEPRRTNGSADRTGERQPKADDRRNGHRDARDARDARGDERGKRDADRREDGAEGRAEDEAEESGEDRHSGHGNGHGDNRSNGHGGGESAPVDRVRGAFGATDAGREPDDLTTPQLMPVVRPPEDEHHTSEFAVPEGLERPSVEQTQHSSEFSVPKGLTTSEQAQQTSEFALPKGLTANLPSEPRSEFRYSADWATPARGTPAVLLAKGLPWHDRMRTMVRLPLSERPAPEPIPVAEGEEEPTPLPVPRVLDLTLRIGELLLASGEGAEDVETAMFAITHAYGLDRCEATVTFTLIGISHQPSLVEAPVSLSRTVRRRGTDYNRLAAVFRLVDDINGGEITLEEAYGRLATIRRNRHPYTKWQLSCAAGLLAGAASVLVGGGFLVFGLAALGAILGDRMAWILASRGLPEFYQFVAAAMAPAAIGVTLAAVHPQQEGLVQAAAVITGGLFALIPGRALVASVQDGLTGYYITAAARLLEVLFLIAGIVLGVLAILYIGEVSGVNLNPETVAPLTRPAVQLMAAMLLALSFCVMLQQDKGTVLIATLNGGVAWLIAASMRDTADLSAFAATLVAAGLVGLFGQLLARYRLTSSLPYVTAAIGPLLPGSAVYFGLLGLAQGDISTGGQQLLRAASLALAIAIGVNLGNEIARLFIGTPGVATPFGRRGAKRTRGF